MKLEIYVLQVRHLEMTVRCVHCGVKLNVMITKSNAREVRMTMDVKKPMYALIDP